MENLEKIIVEQSSTMKYSEALTASEFKLQSLVIEAAIKNGECIYDALGKAGF